MAPTQDIYTARYYVDYETITGRHTMLLRLLPEVSVADAKTRIIAFLNVLKTYAPTTTSFAGLRHAAPGSPFSFSTSWTPIAGTSAATFLPPMYASFVSLVGRDSSGVRTRITLHVTTATPDVDYRTDPIESAGAVNLLAAVAAGPNQFVSKAGFLPIWNQYLNNGYNAYFQRKRRRVA